MSNEMSGRKQTTNLSGFINYYFLLILIGCGFPPAVVHGYDWPMWRYDAGRSAASPEELPDQLVLQWTRELAPPRPAWPKSQVRLQFDASYEPIVAGKTLFVGSMVVDRVTAYDTQTGAEKWRFYTDGPVRFAPVVYKDKLYVASDDGYLYCLNAASGALIRKFLGGPGPNKVIGNHRLIGMWPMRGGPVLYEDTLYFAASIWPFMGTFIYAIDAETGRVIWDNSGSGSTYLVQPHTSPAFAGVAPQGYMVATEDKVLVSGGRSVPAAYDRKTGEFLYYHLNKYSKAGTCEVIASGDYFFNRGTVHKLSDGIAVSNGSASVVEGDVIFGERNDSIVAYKLEPGAKRATGLWQARVLGERGKVHLKAGSRLYCSSQGEEGAIFAVDVPTDDAEPKVSWRGKVDGEVWSMQAADGKLFITTLEGRIYCFGGEKIEPQYHALNTKSLPAGRLRWKNRAKQFLETTNEKEGYCLLLGLGTGELLTELLDQSELHIVALDPDAEKVAAMRRKLDEAGLYGTRAAVHVGDVTTMSLPPYMANLIVSEELEAAGLRKGDLFIERVFHSLRPYGGTACFFLPRRRHTGMLRRAQKLELPRAKVVSSGRLFMLTRSGPLPGSADWTHQYADAANTVMSKDKSVKAPLGLLWFGGPPNDEILPRHGHGPSPQVVDGRLFIEGRNLIRAVDVYTGRLLWERDFQDLGKFYDNTSHQPGANEIGSNYVTVSDAIYLVYGDTIHVLDPATGLTTKEISMPGENKPRWGTIAVQDDLLLATASPLSIPLKDKAGRKTLPKNAQPIIDKGAEWQYLAGSHPKRGWTQVGFNTDGWKTSAAGFGYNNKDNKTTLKDMKGHYSVVYIRKTFSIPEPNNIGELGLAINYDDAFIAYLNGKEFLRVGVDYGSGARTSRINRRSGSGFEYFKIDNPGAFLHEGTNVLAIEGHNENATSSDFALHPYLVVQRKNRELRGGSLKGVAFGDGKRPHPQATLEAATLGLNGLTGVTVDADYASGSKMLVVMDRHTGEILWKRDAKDAFRHNTVILGDDKLFCIDGLSEAKLAYLKRRGLRHDAERTLYALDARTGKVIWKTNESVFGTWLAYSAENDVLLEASSRSGDRAADEADRGMTAYRASDGEVLWRIDESYKGPPILHHDWIITQTGGGSSSSTDEAKVFNLMNGKIVMREHPMTGETIPWSWIRFKGCNTAIASENFLTFRSASAAFVDLTRGQGTATIGGFKSGCSSNLIIADGVMNAPDYTRTCTCSYQNPASLALIPMPNVAYWTFDHYLSPNEPKPVKRVGINLGAPGNRTTEDGTLWLEFPSVGGPSPDIPVRAEYDQPRWYRHHSSCVEGEYNWVAASGVTGLREIRVRVFLQPGRNSSRVDAFDKNIDKIPTWSEDKIKGAFEQPQPYTVRLFFAETQGAAVGQRVFDVSLQDKLVLENFDIVKQASGPNRLVVKEFRGINIIDDLKIDFASKTESYQPLLCGIEIVAENLLADKTTEIEENDNSSIVMSSPFGDAQGKLRRDIWSQVIPSIRL
jgi:outer membrane protein assembly factor BamB